MQPRKNNETRKQLQGLLKKFLNENLDKLKSDINQLGPIMTTEQRDDAFTDFSQRLSGIQDKVNMLKGEIITEFKKSDL